ncbi:MAG TPA: hypothetical protein VGW36_07745 [Pyrinomonadaceae bacterium]|nr:hypothetical protein [Pyrinomonadaceae bacterium]
MRNSTISTSFRLIFFSLFVAVTPALALAQAGNATAAQSKEATKNELAQTRSDLLVATGTYKASAQEVVRFQEQELEAATKKLEQLRQLVADGLVARNELSAGEQEVAAVTARLEETKKQIAASDDLVAQVKKAEELEKTLARQRASQAALARKLVTPTSLRYNGLNGWALSNIGSVQSFFVSTFGKPLPISTLGQSATHNAMRWDHRNAVDVGIHPDSVQGKALLAFLQSKGIPFLAFRGAIPGVSTGPHIHIGYPSSRLG